MIVLHVAPLPEDALGAAASFHAEFLAQAMAAQEDLLLVFSSADHTHRAWRLAAVEGLARAKAPLRVNAVAGDGEASVAAAAAYLAQAQGVTGQLLPLDSQGAGEVLTSLP
ncbi:hypothetical protein EOE18_03965 [Novosphingobium umbonatum]|uniref:Short chain dehydrogenase-like proteobacteria domain-containing protein n=1 Tax=Novosphingobium umbonatum TaxID=1908524 RepID=A0A437NB17_9SPHN|nr:hypothetical protein [Novosphingobium umbonatum]RVU07115.1 hypothetical protein EOE18_03965 [Novosphingobium umbonatum]